MSDLIYNLDDDSLVKIASASQMVVDYFGTLSEVKAASVMHFVVTMERAGFIMADSGA